TVADRADSPRSARAHRWRLRHADHREQSRIVGRARVGRRGPANLGARRGRPGPVIRFVHDPAKPALLPVEPHEGIAPVAVAGAEPAARLVSESLRGTIIRIALPAVASSLLMTLFSSVDAFWIGTRIGATGLAAVSTSLFWIWMIISLA